MRRRLREILPLLFLAILVAGSASAQSQAAPPPARSGPTGSAPMTALVDQLMDLFPKLEGEVLEVRNGILTLGSGVKAGARPGLEVELFREGREIKHPRTGEVLGVCPSNDLGPVFGGSQTIDSIEIVDPEPNA